MGTFWLVVMVIAYFFPTALALTEKKRNTVAIFALNLLLGWTFIGWVVAIVWALTKDREKDQK